MREIIFNKEFVKNNKGKNIKCPYCESININNIYAGRVGAPQYLRSDKRSACEIMECRDCNKNFEIKNELKFKN